jgi:hypothetical protein
VFCSLFWWAGGWEVAYTFGGCCILGIAGFAFGVFHIELGIIINSQCILTCRMNNNRACVTWFKGRHYNLHLLRSRIQPRSSRLSKYSADEMSALPSPGLISEESSMSPKEPTGSDEF